MELAVVREPLADLIGRTCPKCRGRRAVEVMVTSDDRPRVCRRTCGECDGLGRVGVPTPMPAANAVVTDRRPSRRWVLFGPWVWRCGVADAEAGGSLSDAVPGAADELPHDVFCGLLGGRGGWPHLCREYDTRGEAEAALEVLLTNQLRGSGRV